MSLTFMKIVEAAVANVEGVSPADVQQRLEQDPNALLVDVRDAGDIPSALFSQHVQERLVKRHDTPCRNFPTNLRPGDDYGCFLVESTSI